MLKTKKQQLIEWLKKKRIFATHEVEAWGLQHFYIRADRTKRDLMREGLIRKLTEEEKERQGYRGKDALYMWIPQEEKISQVQYEQEREFNFAS